MGLLAGCAKSLVDNKEDSTDENQSEEYSYEFSNNGCKTGAHDFNSLEDLCKGLQDDSLNNNCAYSMRRDLFEAQCSGNFSTFNLVETEESELENEPSSEYTETPEESLEL